MFWFFWFSLSQGENFITSEQLAEEMLRAQERNKVAANREGSDERENIENSKYKVK